MGYGDENDETSEPLIPETTYRARGVPGSTQLGETAEGKPQLGAAFEIVEGPHAGKSVPWYGYFTDKTKKRTLESLRLAGWSNDDIGEIEGFGDAEVDIVVEHNEWEGRVSARVAWVNRAGSGGVAMKTPMNEAQRKTFAAKLKGDAVQSRQQAEKNAPKSKPAPAKNGGAKHPNAPGAAGAPEVGDDDIPFDV